MGRQLDVSERLIDPDKIDRCKKHARDFAVPVEYRQGNRQHRFVDDTAYLVFADDEPPLLHGSSKILTVGHIHLRRPADAATQGPIGLDHAKIREKRILSMDRLQYIDASAHIVALNFDQFAQCRQQIVCALDIAGLLGGGETGQRERFALIFLGGKPALLEDGVKIQREQRQKCQQHHAEYTPTVELKRRGSHAPKPLYFYEVGHFPNSNFRILKSTRAMALIIGFLVADPKHMRGSITG